MVLIYQGNDNPTRIDALKNTKTLTKKKMGGDVEEWTGLQLLAAVRKTQDRHCLRKEIHVVTS